MVNFNGTVFAEDFAERFIWTDYLVFAALLAASLGIGIYYGFVGNKNKTNEDFLMAGRSMPVFPVALSLLCSFISAITLLGNPVEVYFYGMQYVFVTIGFVWMSLALAYIYVPVYYRLELTSAFQYLEMRFHRNVRVTISFSQIVHSLLYMPTTVYGPSIALEAVAGIDGLLSSALIFIVCIAYSSMGGLKAVLWTDALQAFVMLGSLISVIIVGVVDMGGFEEIWRRGEMTGRTNFFNADVDPRTRHTLWTGIFGTTFIYLPLFAATQAQIQRYLSVPTLAKARQCIFLNMLGLFCIVILCSLTGFIIYAKYADCDPIGLKKISTSDQLVPLFVMDVLGEIPILPGLFVAGLTAGSLSTVSSALNSLAAIVTEDFVKKYRPEMTEVGLGYTSKIISVVGGLISFGLIFVISAVGNILPFASVLHGTFIGPILGCFTLGMFFPWTNWLGTLLSIFPAVGLTVFLGVGSILAGNKGDLPNQKLTLGDNCLINGTDDWIGSATEFAPPEIIKWDDWKSAKEYSSYEQFLSISYMWQPIVPILITVFCGLVFSAVINVVSKERAPRVKARLMSTPILNLWVKILGRHRLEGWVDFEDEDEKGKDNLGFALESMNTVNGYSENSDTHKRTSRTSNGSVKM